MEHTDSRDWAIVRCISSVLDLGIRTTAEVFQAVGTFSGLIDRLKSLVRMGPILEAVSLSIIPEIPSGPLAFDISRLDNISNYISNTSSSEQSNSIGQSRECKCGNSSVKKALRALAFSAE